MTMQAPTLLVLAAGMGSRYGGIKQIEGFGPLGETLLEYSIYDAIRAGFGRVVFIVREEIKQAVHDIIAPGLEGRLPYDFALQEIDQFVPEAFRHVQRIKPWGTGHAVLCAAGVINEPFAVINADDFYGPEAFVSMANFLISDQDPHHHAMIGYELGDVLSDHGTVSRGICTTDASGYLIDIHERTGVHRNNGMIIYRDGDQEIPLHEKDIASMNFWGFKPSYFDISRSLFETFLESRQELTKAEFYIPIVAQHMIEQGQDRIAVLRGGRIWFGVTYPEDKPSVQASINELLDKGVYPPSLWK